jgi:membrane protein
MTDVSPTGVRLTAADIMKPSPRTCSPFSTVTEAALIFRDEGCGAVAVLDGDTPVGVLTERDVALAVVNFPDLPSRPVAEIMTKTVATVPEDAALEEIKKRLDEASERRLLVVNGHQHLVGMIAWADLAPHLSREETDRAASEAGCAPEESRSGPRQPSKHGGAGRPGRGLLPILRRLWLLFREAGQQWVHHKVSRLGAALAYYTVFSIAPLLLIGIGVAGLVFGKQAAEGKIADQIESLVGRQAAQAIEAMIGNASWPESGFAAAAIGVGLIFFGAMGVFVELQDAMNTIWDVQPRQGGGWLAVVKDHILSFCLVLATIVLMIVSVVFSTALAALESFLGDWFSSRFDHAVDFAVSFGIITVLFAMIFRFLPDARVAWKDVWLGAAMTSLLFALGKMLLGFYLGHSTVASAYGAAGSLVALMIWAYYSAQIFLFGAELTRVYANKYGSSIVSD